LDVLAAVCVAGAAMVALGGVVTAVRLRRGTALQAAGMTALAVAGGIALFGEESIGASFRSGVSPALGVDPLTGFFLVVLGLTAVPALVFAPGYLTGHAGDRAIGSLMSAFLLALAGLLVARDVSMFLAFWELMTLLPASAILVARRDAAVRSAVYTYLGITHLGGAGVWVALLTLADRGAIGDPAALAAAGSGVQTLVAISALVGFGTKAGFIPLHSWLPRAHPVAPAPFSALMSGVMVKVALYGLIRVEFQWLGATPRWMGIALLACGVLSALGGALWALVQRDLKRVLAYSTIENVGIVALGLGASMLFADAGREQWAAIAFAAALLHIATHALFKDLLFLGAGAIERAAGTLELDRLGGLLARMPRAGGAFLVGCMAIAGLPPLAGFASEWLTLQSLLHAAFTRPLGIAVANAVAAAALAATAAIALLCFVGVAGLVLLGAPRRTGAARAVEPALGMRSALIALAGMCVLAGLLAGLIVPTLAALAPTPTELPRQTGIELPQTGDLPTLTLALGLGVLVLVLAQLRSGRRAATVPTWACGQTVVPELAWTSVGFTKPLRLVLESVFRPAREVEVVRDGGLVQSVHYQASVPSLVDQHLYEPVTRAGLRGAELARRVQTGSVRTYAVYLLVLVIVLLALVRTGALG
jgi:hydrogenase-4 component B